ncbi:DUF3108 domain-containing protein [Gelatiniphilus marinus]|uniref:DUF3108 domain-containing protein n=1 Tax=Gelatiniphilus marinus TaxID=1759464 RepID=A0ABW5JSA5_9FLAO
MIYRFFTVFGFLALSLNAQNNSIAAGEKLTFSAAYNMSGILTDIAEVNMETSSVKTTNATLLRLKFTAATYSKWDHFFKIRDLYESYVNPKNLLPYLYKRDINEGNYYKYMKYVFSHKTKTVKSQLKKKNNYEENKTFSINPETKDIVTSLYKIRLFDFKNMPVGSSKTLTIIFDRKEFTGQITYLGKETLTTAIGKKTCYKIAIGSSQTQVLKGKNSNLLWLTADENKIPVYGKFKIPVGNGELKIKSATGLMH